MNKKVMIVDDDPDILDTLRMILEKQEYDITTVSNGQECIDELEKGFKGVILLDLMMPVMDGWDTIKEIVEKGHMKNVAIEIISALGSREDRRMGILEPHIYDYLTKPIDLKELIESVKKCNVFLYARDHKQTLDDI